MRDTLLGRARCHHRISPHLGLSVQQPEATELLARTGNLQAPHLIAEICELCRSGVTWTLRAEPRVSTSSGDPGWLGQS